MTQAEISHVRYIYLFKVGTFCPSTKIIIKTGGSVTELDELYANIICPSIVQAYRSGLNCRRICSEAN